MLLSSAHIRSCTASARVVAVAFRKSRPSSSSFVARRPGQRPEVQLRHQLLVASASARSSSAGRAAGFCTRPRMLLPLMKCSACSMFEPLSRSHSQASIRCGLPNRLQEGACRRCRRAAGRRGSRPGRRRSSPARRSPAPANRAAPRPGRGAGWRARSSARRACSTASARWCAGTSPR